VRHRSALDYREWLRSGRWFGGLSEPFQDELLRAASLRSLAAGELLHARGDPSPGLYAVLDGAIRVGGISESGQEALLALLEPPSWFGEISTIDRQPCTHDLIAGTESLLLHVSQEAIEAILQTHPLNWRDLARLVTGKLRLAFVVLEDIALLPLSVRLARRLVLMAEGYGQRARRSRTVEVSQEQLAMMLGTSRQTTNQLLKELQARGMLRLSYGTIEILDLDGLHRAATAGLPP
jgi:CRP-like cAMP-binding protein